MYAHGVKRRQFMQALAASTPLLFDAELLAGQDPWDRVRDLFLIPRNRIYLNVGTLGAQPRSVVHAVEDSTRKVAESFPPGVPWDAIKQKTAALID
jgi:kynureninase